MSDDISYETYSTVLWGTAAIIASIHTFACYDRSEMAYTYVFGALLLTLLYEGIIWYFYGKDPSPHPVVPDWNPPSDLTPLECAFINNNGEPPSNMLITHLIWLAHKKIITVTKEHDKYNKKHIIYHISLNKNSHPTDTESELFYNTYYLSDLFIDNEPDELLINYLIIVKNKLQKKMERLYFYTRHKLAALSTLSFPLVLCFFAYPQFYTTMTHYAPAFLLFLLFLLLLIIFATGYILFVLFLSTEIVAFIGKYLFKIPHVFWQIIRRLILILPSVPLIESQPSLIPLCLVYIATSIVFSNIIFQPTKFGQRKKEKIEGLKMFLETISSSSMPIKPLKNEYGLSMEKRLTPEDIQGLFPYAVAFGYEKEWQKKFKDILEDKHSIENLTMITSSFLNNLDIVIPIRLKL